jgi:hypothetical protein
VTRRFAKEKTMHHVMRNAVIAAGLTALLVLPTSAWAHSPVKRAGAGWLGVAVGIMAQVLIDRCSIERWNQKVRVHCN